MGPRKAGRGARRPHDRPARRQRRPGCPAAARARADPERPRDAAAAARHRRLGRFGRGHRPRAPWLRAHRPGPRRRAPPGPRSGRRRRRRTR